MNTREFLDMVDSIAEKAYGLEFVGDYKFKNSQLISLFEEVRAINKEIFNDSDLDKELSSIGEPYFSKKKNWNYRRGNLFRLLGQIRNRIELRLDKELNSNYRSKNRVFIEKVEAENILGRAVSFLDKAKEYIVYSETLFKKGNWDKSVQQSILSIEFSLKCVLIMLLGKFPTSHDFQDESSLNLIKEARNKLSKKGVRRLDSFGRIFFIPHFWSKSYTYSKYGGEYGESKNIYKEIEANLAKAHASEVYSYANGLYSILPKE